MQTEKKIYIALAVLLVLAGALFLQTRKSKEEAVARTPSASSASLPQMKLQADSAEQVTKLVINSKEEKEVVLEKRGDSWWLTKPVEALASQQNVKSALDNLKSIEVKDMIDDTEGAVAMYKDYDLEGDNALHVAAFKDGDKLSDAYFGKSGSRGQTARLADKPGIWIVTGFSSFQFARKVKDWREKQVLKFEDANVVSVSLQNENGKFSFSKNDETWSGTQDGKPIKDFAPDKVKDMLRAFRNLFAEDFAAPDKNPAELKLEPPLATITFTLKDDAGSHVMTFGDSSSGASRYARKTGDATTFVIGSWASDWAVAKADKFQKADDKKADGGKAKGDDMPPMDMPSFH